MDGPIKKIENMNTNERIARLIVSLTVVVFNTQAPWVGTSLFTMVNILAAMFIVTVITGWDPVRAMSFDKLKKIGAYFPRNTDKHHGPLV